MLSLAHAHELLVDFRSDYIPQKDFSWIEVDVERVPYQSGLSGRRLSYFPADPGINFAAGVRLASYRDIDSASYDIAVTLYKGDGSPLITRHASIELDNDYAVTLIASRPGSAVKSLSLVGDKNGDGVINYGDVIRISVEIESVSRNHSALYTDNFDNGNILCAGSVKAPSGVIQSGNGANDKIVVVRFLKESSQKVAISYDAIAAPDIITQGAALFGLDENENYGTGADGLLTDDPATVEKVDATRRKVVLSGAQNCSLGPTLYNDDAVRSDMSRTRPDIEADQPIFAPDLSGADAAACREGVQDKIAWNRRGDKHWAEENLVRLCAGAEDSVEPGLCFQEVMHSRVLDIPARREWNWPEAVSLCAGSRDHQATIRCYQSAIADGRTRQSAIRQCSAETAR